MPKMKLTLGEVFTALTIIKEFLNARMAEVKIDLSDKERHDLAVKILLVLTSNGRGVSTDLITSVWKQISDALTALLKSEGDWFAEQTPFKQLKQAARLTKLTWSPPTT